MTANVGGIRREGGYYCSGMFYPNDYVWTAYPLSSSPHGGIFRKLPQFYQDYERERARAKRKMEKEQDEKERKKARDFFRRFGGFFGFENEEIPKEEADPNYPYSVFGLKKSSSDEDMKKAYRKSVLKAHPDKGGNAELFRKIQDAWNYFREFCKM